MHDVGVVPGPQRRRRPAQILRHLVDLEHRAVAHVPRDRRLAVADDAAADHRAAAVRADQGGGGNALPAGNLDCDAIALVAKASHARAGAQLDRALLPAAVEQRAVDIGAVRHRVRIAEALREARVERDVDHCLAAAADHHQQVLDEHERQAVRRGDASRGMLVLLPLLFGFPCPATAAPEARVSETYGKLPLHFEANQGQTHQDVRFLARGPGYSLYLTAGEAVLVLTKPNPDATQARATPVVVRMSVVGGAPNPPVTGLDELPGNANYLIGHPANWRTDV